MTEAYLQTWQGTLTTDDLQTHLQQISNAVWIVQRPGDFILDRIIPESAADWSSGRCFNEEFEIRWWSNDTSDRKSVLILNQLPPAWAVPEEWHISQSLVAPSRTTRYLCVGEYDHRSSEGTPIWWETRYSRAFTYLDTPPPTSSNAEDQTLSTDGFGEISPQGRVYLVAQTYELVCGTEQHRLLRFEHVQAEEKQS